MYKTPAAIMIGAMIAFLPYRAAVSQTPPKPVIKVLLNNTSVQVNRVTYAPGAVSPMRERGNALVYVLSGPQHAKITYADGHTVIHSYPTGAVNYEQDAMPLSITNVGRNSFTWLVVIYKK